MKRAALQGIGVVFAVGLIAYFAPQIVQNDTVQSLVGSFGYAGVFVIALVSGFNVVVPIPVFVFTPLFVESGLSFGTLVIVMALGMTMGDVLGYAIGYVTRSLVAERARHGRIARMVDWAERHGKMWPYVLLGVYATIAPGPNELIIIPMAFMGYRLKYIFPVVFIGNTIFVTLGSLGMTQLVKLF